MKENKAEAKELQYQLDQLLFTQSHHCQVNICLQGKVLNHLCIKCDPVALGHILHVMRITRCDGHL